MVRKLFYSAHPSSHFKMTFVSEVVFLWVIFGMMSIDGYPCGDGNVCSCEQDLVCRIEEENVVLSDVVSKGLMEMYGSVGVEFGGDGRLCPPSSMERLLMSGYLNNVRVRFPFCGESHGDERELGRDLEIGGNRGPSTTETGPGKSVTGDVLGGLSAVGVCCVGVFLVYVKKRLSRSRSGNTSKYGMEEFCLDCLGNMRTFWNDVC